MPRLLAAVNSIIIHFQERDYQLLKIKQIHGNVDYCLEMLPVNIK